jgi:hypothetical protein
MLCCIILASSLLAAASEPKPGDPVDLAPFGHDRTWDGYRGIEWDEPRDVRRVVVEFPPGARIPDSDSVRVEYWVSSWPPVPGGGWTKVDTPWQGEWREIHARSEVNGNSIDFQFEPLSPAENPNAGNLADFAPSFRRTLKIRTRMNSDFRFAGLHAYGSSRWNVREINLQTGCEGKPEVVVSATAYNGSILSSQPLQSTPPGTRLGVLYTEHEPDSNDRTILSIHGAKYDFGVSVDEIAENKAVYVRTLGMFLGDAATGEDFARFQESSTMQPGQDIISRTSKHPEQSLDNALAEIPRLALTSRASRHPFRYIPLGFTASREKYGLDFDGNVFISKHGSKAMKEDLARMLWDGDEIYFRLGTGAVPDFRERQGETRQRLLDDYLPLVTTFWRDAGVDYEEQACATVLKAPLDDTKLRGDEPSVLFLRVHARNEGARPVEARVWFQVSPAEQLKLQDGMLSAVGNSNGEYPHTRLRAILEAPEGSFQMEEVPPAALVQVGVTRPPGWHRQTPPLAYGGSAVVWAVTLPPHGVKTLDLKIPFRTMESDTDAAEVRRIHFDTRLDETLAYWKKVAAAGMKLHVPDETLNRFYLSVLQHILVSDEKDIKTGYDMCPCGTYDYNMFANETDIQVRLLDMRGLSGMAWRCLRPIVELQGSKPFPGRFQTTAAEFHGVKVDADHDYTQSGYNLNHGWTLWTLSEHYLFTRDRDWLRSVLPHMIKAANWITDERKATMQHDTGGGPVMNYGLLPAGELEDNEDWEYWFAVNAYAYRGLNAAASAISAEDRVTGERLRQEAEAYREDIRKAALRALSITPVVRLRDGTYVPAIPPRTGLHGRDLGWIRNVLYGAHTLIDCGVFDPNEPVATWTLQDYEDNLFMAPDSLSIPDRDWFSRGGVALQPNLVNTPVSYLERDQEPQAVRALFNDFAISHYPDVNAFTEWVPTLGLGGGPFFKTSDEAAFLTWLRLLLVRESGDRLYLDSGAPRSWFLPGRTIEVDHAASFFGEVSFRIDSHPDQGFIEAHISLPQRNPPQQIVLRLRHPEGRKMASVEVNGSSWTRFDSGLETIDLPTDARQIDVRAIYP